MYDAKTPILNSSCWSMFGQTYPNASRAVLEILETTELKWNSSKTNKKKTSTVMTFSINFLWSQKSVNYWQAYLLLNLLSITQLDPVFKVRRIAADSDGDSELSILGQFT